MSTQDKSSSRSRSKAIGKSAIKNTPQKDTKKVSLFRRLDIRFPWLKLVLVVFIGIVAILDLLDLTISKTNNHVILATVAPMQKHVKVTERVLVGKKLVALTFDDGPSSATKEFRIVFS